MRSSPVYNSRRERMKLRFANELGLDISNSASPLGLLADSILYELSLVEDGLFGSAQGKTPISAVGSQLDDIGATYNLPRVVNTKAYASGNDKNLVISVDSGTIRNYLGSSIPAGTEFRNASGTKIYKTQVDTPVPQDARSITVTVVSDIYGSGQNASQGEINTHDLGSNIKVSNLYPITSGIDYESDSDYRARLISRIRGGIQPTPLNLISSLMSIPDVKNVIYMPNARGAGAAAFMLIPRYNTVSSGSVSVAEAMLRDLLPVGIIPVVMVPKYKGITLEAVIEFSSNAVSRDKPRIKKDVEDAILRYIGEVQVGGLFNLQDLYRSIITSFSPYINSVKTTCLKIDGIKVTSGVVQLGKDELLVPEGTVKSINVYYGDS